MALLAVVVAAAAFVAWRNHRLGRGDLRGALRRAVLTAVCWLLSWGLSEHHVPDVVYLGAVYRAIGSALCIAAIAWVLYMAIEPVVRRRWPHCLVAWTRVLNGRVLEPLVGGHILIGTALGVGYSCWFSLVYSVLLQRLTVYGTLDPSIFNGAGSALSAWLRVVVISIGTALGLFVLFSLTRIILRRKWAAAVAFVVLASAPEILLNPHPLAAAIVEVPDAALSLWILVHLGVLVMVVATFVSYVLVAFPLSAEFSAWYAGATLFAVATVLILAMVSFRIALAGRPLLRDEILEVGG